MDIYADDDDLHVCIDDAISKLTHYYDQMSPAVGVALFLDPGNKGRILKKMGWEDKWIETANENFDIAFDLYEKMFGPVTRVLPSAKRIKINEAAYAAWNHQFSSSDVDEEQAASNEVKQYFDSPRHKGGDAMMFWKTNRYTYPILSAMARDFLAIQASSVPSERAFSSGGNLVSKRRCSMTGKTIEMTQFLKYCFRDSKSI